MRPVLCIITIVPNLSVKEFYAIIPLKINFKYGIILLVKFNINHTLTAVSEVQK